MLHATSLILNQEVASKMTETEFIQQHRNEDVHTLAFKKIPDGMNLQFCLQQIEGWQLACKKLPHWSEKKDILFPPRLSMEQCSSQYTSLYKRQIAERLLPEERRQEMVDLTGGYGVDFSYLAPIFKHATYVEQNPDLCKLAQHNFPVLGLSNTSIVCGDGIGQLTQTKKNYSLVYLDPARRDKAGRKTVALEDCTPDITSLATELLLRSHVTLVKLSPMLDISLALHTLKNVSEVHVVSVEGECKELLFVITAEKNGEVKFHCVNLRSEDPVFVCSETERHTTPDILSRLSNEETFLYEPNASILKASVQNALCSLYNLKKLHSNSHLFVNNRLLKDFPGRSFHIVGWSDFSRQSLCKMLGDLKQANLATRNFPTSVAVLRKRLKLREGGKDYLFATTQADGSHILIRGEKTLPI
ncbi:MAG: hypothetical protein J5661_04240 [Bacteroidaceae bacterium]|nr:hypothetical protein [Bacteroidaceae bacterium]